MRSSRSPPRFGIGQANQADADLDFHRIDGQIVLDPLFRRLLGCRRRPCSAACLGVAFAARVSITRQPDAAAADAPAAARVGRLVKTSIARKPPVTASACGRENSCVQELRAAG